VVFLDRIVQKKVEYWHELSTRKEEKSPFSSPKKRIGFPIFFTFKGYRWKSTWY